MPSDSGLKSTLAAIDRARKAARIAVKPALMKSANEIAAAQSALAPVLTGDLKDSIAVTAPGETTPPYSQPGGSRVAGETEVVVTAGNSDVRYPHLVEYGAAHAEAQPFFWPAYRLLKTRAQRRIKRVTKKAIKEAFDHA